MLDFTVAIPTYNGASRLPQVLEKLQQQRGTEEIAWEVLVIDNNSTDDTAKVVQLLQDNWPHPYPLRYCFEAQQGLAFARQRAIAEAQGSWIGFLDDDNLAASDWVAAACSFVKDYPKAGAISGQIHASFEAAPPENFKQIEAFLAIREHGPTPFQFEPENLRLPPGAGLVVRKQAWVQSVPSRLALQGRVGKAAVAGEDYEVLLYMHKAGWEIWYNPAMHIEHRIPRSRLEREYLLPLARGIGLATCQLRMINAKTWQKPLIWLRTLLGNLRRVMRHWLHYRGRVETELIPAFEMAFYWGSLMSPFFYIKRTMQMR
ncbi:hormogonium polysaccharide biosynthesis glycosyltransferase HpsE [Phormidium sp. CCY1219]|uniref:hormogonium polysaccharide biosynthesis glycosyltransferase HpsE n=1 Tax=Phormidium sp. CCY1219 TaxID=2886104 RepID=UPI002D1EE523|nr:hormogonium polysaccharide biosynthesis glycosyltransferase HpsE [Phormidium sp. CCY1219]MEB3831299.1 hormogonium polysaccharide biosynthesis glycosyltransferase HpsE [Phormidium sp. CCY1219]